MVFFFTIGSNQMLKIDQPHTKNKNTNTNTASTPHSSVYLNDATDRT